MLLRAAILLLALLGGPRATSAFRPASTPVRPLPFRAWNARPPGSASEPVIIRIRNPSQAVRRVDPARVPYGDSAVLRLKPVIRFHPTQPIGEETRNDVEDKSRQLYDSLGRMGLARMGQLMHQANLGPQILAQGPVTLFAPTDEAFSLAPRGFLETLDLDALTQFLLHHATRGHVAPGSLRNDAATPSLAIGSPPLRLNVYHGGQMISVSGAQFLDSSQRIGDVLVQPVDRVLHPTSETNLVETARRHHQRMHALLAKSGLAMQLSSGTFTLFAPTDEAFDSLSPKANELLLGNAAALRRVMLSHVVPGAFFSTALGDGSTLRALGGEQLTFAARRGLILVNGVPVVHPDLPATNGVLHSINRLLVPADLAEQCQCVPRFPLPATLRPASQPAFGTRISTSNRDHYNHAATPLSTETSSDEENANDLDRRLNNPLPMNSISPEDPNFATPPAPPLLQLMEAPLVLPDGRRATFETANRLLRKSLLFNRLRQNSTRGITVLLPTDEAFGRLPKGAEDRLTLHPALLRRTLRWHLADGVIPDPASMSLGGSPTRIATLGGSLLVSSLHGGKTVLVGGARVLGFRRASGGVVLAVDRVAFPPPVATVFEGLPPMADSSVWRKIIEELPDLRDQLKSKENLFTMFAPSNQAFDQLPRDILRRLLSEPQLRRDLVRSHVVRGAYFRPAITSGMELKSLSNKKLSFGLVPGGFLVNEVPVSRPSIVSGNGVVYVVDRLLIDSTDKEKPATEGTLEDLARKVGALKFFSWMREGGLIDVVRARGPCTVFLPTDVALSSMSPTLLTVAMADPKQRERLVRFHLSPGPWKPTPGALLPSMLSKKPIRCNAYGGGQAQQVVTVSGCPVSEVVEVDNSTTVVVLDRPMAPPAGNLFVTISKSPLLRNFTKIVRVAGMENELSGDAPFTLFAPDQCAFSLMSAEEYTRLISDTQAARGFVERHMVRGSFYSTGLRLLSTLDCQDGSALRLDATPDCITVNDVKVKYGDMSATNGVLHVLASVL